MGADPALFPIDPNGNLTTKTEGSDTWGYEWNALNQLTRVTKNSIEQVRFAYDPLGRRVERVAGGVTTSYAYDGDDILREVQAASTLKYVHGPGFDEPLAADDGNALAYFHADGLGSIVKVTNGAGAVTITRQYDAWGNLEVGASEPGYAYTGREWDPATGLYYYRARYYDAKAGRFVSEDPIRLAGGSNFYRYVGNNPARFIDPTGLKCCDCPGGAWLIDGGPGVSASAAFGIQVSVGNFVCNSKKTLVRRAIVICSIGGLIVSTPSFGADYQTWGQPPVTGVPCSDDLSTFFWRQYITLVGPYYNTDDGQNPPSNDGLQYGLGLGRARMQCMAIPI